jgi:hypothetical protein
VNITRAFRLLIFLFCSAITLGSDSGPTEADVWQPLRPFLGQWEGDVQGEPGTGKAERTYAFALRERFIQITNKSVYPPQEKNPKEETHEDIGFLSYDRRARKFMLRQFHIEGFVNQFALETSDEEHHAIVFVSTAIENIAPGCGRGRRIVFLNMDEFIETFALAAPGKDFATYSETHFRRKQRDRRQIHLKFGV